MFKQMSHRLFKTVPQQYQDTFFLCGTHILLSKEDIANLDKALEIKKRREGKALSDRSVPEKKEKLDSSKYEYQFSDKDLRLTGTGQYTPY